jgi:hypothetical protein
LAKTIPRKQATPYQGEGGLWPSAYKLAQNHHTLLRTCKRIVGAVEKIDLLSYALSILLLSEEYLRIKSQYRGDIVFGFQNEFIPVKRGN